jgi:hypothetical protein
VSSVSTDAGFRLTRGLPTGKAGLFTRLAAGSPIDEIGVAATGTLYAARGLALMLAIVPRGSVASACAGECEVRA